MKPIVAIIGRPNVGKSTFFNRITRTTRALVDGFPGVTRDRLYGEVQWGGVRFTVIDTGGFDARSEDAFAADVRMQIQSAIEDADLIVHLLDGREGISPFDRDIIDLLRGSDRKVFFAVNKIDGPEKEVNIFDFHSLGIETLYPVSAASGYGVSDFLDGLIAELPESGPELSRDAIRISVVGRPNVGKSSLINRVLGEERLIVSEIPGTTRDAIDTICERDGKSYLLIDTAGIRRKARVTRKIEKFSAIKALRSLNRCDVALIVMDAGEGVVEQDITVAGYALDRGCACIFLLNKWDLVPRDGKTGRRHMEHIREGAKFMNFAPILTVSALTGSRVNTIFPAVDDVYRQYASRTGTGRLNQILARAIEKNAPPLYRGKRIKLYYATQVSSLPPTIVCFVNYPEAIHFSYRRYLINRFREETGLDKCPVRVLFRERAGRLQFPKRKRT